MQTIDTNRMGVLRSFCASESDPREWMRTPFRVGDYAYATNGHFLVRVAADGLGLSELGKGGPINVEELVAKNVADKFEPFPKLPRPRTCFICSGKGFVLAHTCPDCDGEGEFDHGDHTYECKECDGDGFIYGKGERRTCHECDGRKVERHQIHPLGCSSFDLAYLHHIKRLPGAEIHIRPMPGCAFFRFDGGGGLFMPARMS